MRRFDAAYLELYPYLRTQLRPPRHPGESLLEIGLATGTVSQHLAETGFGYHGIDVAGDRVERVRERLRRLYWGDAHRRVIQASAFAVPFDDATFEHVVSIEGLHHTGDLPRAVAEVRRVLRPGGTVTVMLRNRRSPRRLLGAPRSGGGGITEFVTARQVREAFGSFSDVRIERHGLDPTRLARSPARELLLSRDRVLPTIADVLGVDLYVHAVA